MFRERNEWPSTAGGLPAEERSGYMELCAVGRDSPYTRGMTLTHISSFSGISTTLRNILAVAKFEKNTRALETDTIQKRRFM